VANAVETPAVNVSLEHADLVAADEPVLHSPPSPPTSTPVATEILDELINERKQQISEVLDQLGQTDSMSTVEKVGEQYEPSAYLDWLDRQLERARAKLVEASA